MTEFEHTSVLLHETIDNLDVKDGGTYVDCTFGGGGHAAYLLSKLQNGTVIGFDQDSYAITAAQTKFEHELQEGAQPHLKLVKANFSQLAKELAARGIENVDGIYYDLGVSSPQFDQPERGFSYRFDAKLDMRMNQEQQLSAYEVVNEWDYSDLVRILYRYGDEKFAKQIARQIEKSRAIAPIETTFQLSDLIKEAIPAFARRTGGHPAKKSFQAIRIAVNDELNVLSESLEEAIKLLAPGGRISVITFQSDEDRIVKQIFKKYSEVDLPRGLPVIPDDLKPILKLINRKPILATEEELANNKRSHSAKLRVAEKI